MVFHEEHGLKYLTLQTFDEYDVPHGFFSRRGGISPQPWASLNVATSVGDSRDNVIENRNRIMHIFGKNYTDVFDVWQIHSDIVQSSEEPRSIGEPHKKGDAIITSNPQVALMMVFADCVPILLYDVKKNIGAIVHAGWQGTVKYIACRTIEKMQNEYGCDTQNILAGIGPSISVDHYEIQNSTAEVIRESFPNGSEKIIAQRDDKLFFDLWAANELLLRRYPLKSIEIAGICTACELKDWYSHRAENGKTGRFAAVLNIKP